MRKMEQEMEEVFEMKVQEKLQKLKDIEADVSQSWLLRAFRTLITTSCRECGVPGLWLGPSAGTIITVTYSWLV